MNRSDIKEGARLLLVITHNVRHPQKHEIVVAKIGRRWASYHVEGKKWLNGQFDLSTFYVDGNGYSSPGRVYRDEFDYDDAVDAERMWKLFAAAVRGRYTPPENVDAGELRHIAKRLGFELEKGR